MTSHDLSNVVTKGRAIVSGDTSVITSTIQHAIQSGRNCTFYVPRDQGLAILRWYWTPALVASVGLKAVPREEKAKIEQELNIKISGECFSNYLECPNGHPYGAFEFILQGIRQHGPEYLRDTIAAEDVSVLRVNPSGWEFCPVCDLMIVSGGHYYSFGDGRYGCCRGQLIVL